MLRTGASLLCVMLMAQAARANPASLVPTAADVETPSLFHVSVDYAYTIESSNIERENVGAPGTSPNGPLGTLDDLSFQQVRHTVTPKLELGVLKDSWLSFAVPIVVAQSRELSLSDGVTRAGSSTIRDGLLTADGFDARDPGTPLPAGGDLLFRGENRSGLDQLYIGLGIAPMSQQRDDTKPTWKLGAELRLAVGKVMRFDAMKTGEETGVSRGVHELQLWTSFARRFPYVLGYFDMWWLVPLTARESSLYDDIDQQPGTFGSTNTMPGQEGGISFGIEAFAIDDPITRNSVSLDVGARIVGHFEGREYTEMWEVFALAGDVRTGGPLVMDRNPSQAGLQAVSHPGISNIENYLETAARVGIRGTLGARVHFGVIADVAWKTDHAITFADAGVDLATCTGAGGEAPGRTCEIDANDLVTPGTSEVNPLHVPRVDVVGHRYLSVDNLAFSIGVQAQVLF
ncbi:MAG TPA: hypothetical protein VK427_26130 [Kofleriaceae bacterium]|nr:hypothetical protein [Kofleriaceae bacterium]